MGWAETGVKNPETCCATFYLEWSVGAGDIDGNMTPAIYAGAVDVFCRETMIITKKYVVLNFPKTGSSFMRSVIRRLHRYDALYNKLLRKLGLPDFSGMKVLLHPQIYERVMYKERTPHGIYSQIPAESKQKTVVTITRNPFERYVSAYLFGWWKKSYLATHRDQVLSEYPHFPDLSFSEYYEMIHGLGMRNKVTVPTVQLGVHTVQFIWFYFSDPLAILSKIDKEYIAKQKYRKELPPITFLHQESLNGDLFDFLLRMGYPQKRLEFVKSAQRVNSTQRNPQEQYLTEEVISQIYQRDALIFDLFPEYRVF